MLYDSFREDTIMFRQTFKNIVAGMAIGFFVGLVICAYRFLMTFGDKTLNGKIFPLIHESAVYCIPWALLLVVLALIVHKLIRLEPDAKGGGIPHAVKESEKSSDSRWWSVVLAKLITAPDRKSVV